MTTEIFKLSVSVDFWPWLWPWSQNLLVVWMWSSRITRMPRDSGTSLNCCQLIAIGRPQQLINSML